jgi:TetR/AcrR family transcriptional regulator, transcriptional repressor for nem operon
METNTPQYAIRTQAGRPREFDLGKVLDEAITVFSRNGYSATSVSDLTTALGLSSGSLYKAFGDKRGVFMAALERYVQVRDRKLEERLATVRTGREKIRTVLASYAESSHGECGRTGCLVVGSAVEFASSDPEMGRKIASLLSAREARLARFIREGQTDGSVRPHVDPDVTARVLICVLQGMRVIGKAGRDDAEMVAIVEDALRLLD